MKINEITISQKIQARQYEPIELAVTATLNDGENPDVAISQLRRFVDLKIRQEGRHEQFEKFSKELQTEGLGDRRKEEIEDWMTRYHESEEEITRFEFA